MDVGSICTYKLLCVTDRIMQTRRRKTRKEDVKRLLIPLIFVALVPFALLGAEHSGPVAEQGKSIKQTRSCGDSFQLNWNRTKDGDAGGMAALAMLVGYFGMKTPGMSMDFAGMSHPTTVLALNALARGVPDNGTGISLIDSVFYHGSGGVVKIFRECLKGNDDLSLNQCASDLIARNIVENIDRFIERTNQSILMGQKAICLDPHNVFRTP